MLLAAILLGGHWAALQSVAWAGMLVSRVQKMSVQDAITTTFDGDHPCPMCKAIKKAKQADKAEEKKGSLVVDSVRLPHAVISSGSFVVPPDWSLKAHSASPSTLAMQRGKPHVPPPRSFS